MVSIKAHAKINWTLDILGRRADGYHQMDMLMQTLSLYDLLTLEEADELSLSCSLGLTPADMAKDELSASDVPCGADNLVYRAAEALRSHSGVSRGARMSLQKSIPSGAGLGGGSADAAAALIGLNRLWRLALSREELMRIGLTIGADVPFLVHGGLARVGGIGEQITALSPAPEIWLLLVQPCGGLSTREVFNAYDALPLEAIRHPSTQDAQSALLACDLHALGSAMGNVLEPVGTAARPPILQTIRNMEAAGAIRAMMTGSGSVVYGVFPTRRAAEEARKTLVQCAREVILTHTLGE